MRNWLLLSIFFPVLGFSQLNGNVLDKKTRGPIYGAKVFSDQGERTLTDTDGSFILQNTKLPTQLIVSATGYITDTILAKQEKDLKIVLKSEIQEIKTVVVTAGRRDQQIEEVPISMEIIRPELVDNKGVANLEQAVDQSPGVYTMDSQVSIRGGSGYAYGAGSRVLLLYNGVPILSGDAGDAKWNAIPMESASQIEVIKGASSVLYGSGALNGIISLSEREPGLEGEFRAKVQSGIYDNPKRSSLKWWSKNPIFYQGDVYYGKMFKKTGFTISAAGYSNPGYKEGEQEDRGRVNGTFYFRPEAAKNLKAGLTYSLQSQKTGNFIIWESDSLGYTPGGGADTSLESSTLTYNKGWRINIDPYLKVYDKFKNLHSVKARYYFIQNTNVTNTAQSSNSSVYYGDYQFQHNWQQRSVITAGLTGIRTDVSSNLFGDHFSNNIALYTQFEQKYKKFDLVAGVRLEHFEQDRIKGDTYYYLNEDSTSKLPVYPIARLGLHYEAAKATHLRASFGQGIRYPSVAERYTYTSVGALNVFPNANLIPETGWAAELGIKQIVKIGDGWKGMIDLAGFINQYNNMMEFQFGLFNPVSYQRMDLNNPDDLTEFLSLMGQGYTLNQMLGFSAVNAEKAKIIGGEFSFSSMGKIGDVTITSLIGYTYMEPLTLNNDKEYLQTYSTYKDSIHPSGDTTFTVNKMLKYRFRHLIKGDIEAEWKGLSVGFSVRYNSNMENIDAIFEEDIAGTYILPGLKSYREEYNKGALVFDVRLGYQFMEHYRIGFIINNLLNEEYSSRPGDIQAPRNYMLQLQFKF